MSLSAVEAWLSANFVFLLMHAFPLSMKMAPP